ncbi:MAG TPA: IPTL-CTERM sorting domain-containing protein [Casimicrobiaceae bacterium]
MSRWLALIAASLPLPAFAGVVCGSSFPIPAIDDVGLIVLAALVAGVAGWAAKRRK